MGEWQPESQPQPATQPLLEENNRVPAQFLIEQNYPNPFNPATSISYQLPEASTVTLQIYSLLRQKIRTLVDEQKAAGSYSI